MDQEYDQMVEVVIDFAETVIPGKNFAIIGESYGGYLARGIVHHLPPRIDGLFVWAPATYPRSERKRPEHVVRIKDDRVAAELTTQAEKEMFGLFVVQSQKAIEFARAHITPGWEIADQEFIERVTDTRFSFDLSSQRFQKPTLIACGRQDAVVGYEEAYEALSNYSRATIVIVDGAGHALGFTEGEHLFGAAVNAWLDSLEQSEFSD